MDTNNNCTIITDCEMTRCALCVRYSDLDTMMIKRHMERTILNVNKYYETTYKQYKL